MSDEEQKKKDKAERRKKALKFFEALDDIPPCKFCGRLVLAGICCQKRLDAAKKFKYKK